MSKENGIVLSKVSGAQDEIGHWLLILVVLTAVFFRFHALTEIPPGMSHDEADVGFFVRQITNNTGFTIDTPYGYANEPFTKYSASVVMALIGQSDWALRIHQAGWGVLLVVFTYKWGRAAFNRNVGVGGAALVAVSYWATATSRFALNSNPTVALFTGAVWMMWIALFRRKLRQRWVAWLGFAILLACALLTYEAARGAWLTLPAFFGLLTAIRFVKYISNRFSLKVLTSWVLKLETPPTARLIQFALALALGTGLALPHLLNPAAWGRSGALAGPLTEAAHGNLGPIWANTVDSLDALFRVGDNFTVYNLTGRPTIDPAMSLLFVVGLLWCVWHWRKPSAAFLLLWLVGGLAPSTVSGARWVMLHAITLQGLVAVACVIGVDQFATLLRKYGRYVWAAFVGLIIIAGGWTYRDYFLVWGQATEIRVAYLSNFNAVLDYVRSSSHAGSVTLSAPFPYPPLDPFIFDLRVRRSDIDACWFDARQALVFPQTDESLLMLPSTTPLDPVFAVHLPDSERHIIRPTDVDPYFDTVLWKPNATIESWLNDPALQLAQPPADFGGAAQLMAFQILTPTIKPGETVNTLSFWKVLEPANLGPRDPTLYAPEARLFVHLLDNEGNYITGDDRLDAPAWNWRSGDTIAQLHHITFPSELSPGTYELRTGIYTLPSVTRLTGSDFDSFSLGRIAVIAP